MIQLLPITLPGEETTRIARGQKRCYGTGLALRALTEPSNAELGNTFFVEYQMRSNTPDTASIPVTLRRLRAFGVNSSRQHPSILLVRVAGELDYFAISIPVVSTLFFHTIPNHQLIKVKVHTIGLSIVRVEEKLNYAIFS